MNEPLGRLVERSLAAICGFSEVSEMMPLDRPFLGNDRTTAARAKISRIVTLQNLRNMKKSVVQKREGQLKRPGLFERC